MTLPQLYATEDRIIHKVDVATFGFVRVNANNVYVTPNSFLAPFTTVPSIQRGIDAASAGDTVNVEAGLFQENVTVNKSLTLLGANAGVAGSATRSTETEVRTNGVFQNAIFTVTASGVTIDGFYRGQRPVRDPQPR